MKKAEKQEVLKGAIGTYQLCRCHFNYDPNYWYYYIFDVSDKLLFGAEEDDFTLDGFEIRKISDLKKVEINDALCVKMNEEAQILKDLQVPKIDITSWKSALQSLKDMNAFIAVENENAEDYYLGYVTEIKKACILFNHVDADGEWYENIEIPYSEITSVSIEKRYTSRWRQYLTEHNLMPK